MEQFLSGTTDILSPLIKCFSGVDIIEKLSGSILAMATRQLVADHFIPLNIIIHSFIYTSVCMHVLSVDCVLFLDNLPSGAVCSGYSSLCAAQEILSSGRPAQEAV